MHIVHVASELAPIAKVGGLADVILGLNRELSLKGCFVNIIIPKYDVINTSEIKDFSLHSEIQSYFEEEFFSNTIWSGQIENFKIFLIEPHHPRNFFNRGCYYGCEDDVERYLFFSKAAFDFISSFDIPPDIIHLHDWQTAAIAPLYWDAAKKKERVIFTIHNLEHQGKCKPINLNQIGLHWEKFLKEDRMQDPFYPDTINLVKGGIVFSDYITTVSLNYAWEITTKEGGRGLEATINKHINKFEGVLNGVDYAYWNPEVDKYLPIKFSSRRKPSLNGKAIIKKILRDRIGLSNEHRPLIACITRLVPQKGIELIKHVILSAEQKKAQFVLLGTSPIPSIALEFYELKEKFIESPYVHLILHHEEELAHLIFAGADIFIVPSLFEPCGLTQLISMKYGTVPVVRKTGGLADTVFDVDYDKNGKKATNGFLFDHPDPTGIDSALDRAIKCWYDNPKKWKQLVIQDMNQDFSWNKPSDKYLEIYRNNRSLPDTYPNLNQP